MKPGSKLPLPIDFSSIAIGSGIGLITLFVPLLSVMAERARPVVDLTPMTRRD